LLDNTPLCRLDSCTASEIENTNPRLVLELV
jgi:hypothetical protein